MAGVVLVSGNTVFVEEHRSVIHGDCPIRNLSRVEKVRERAPSCSQQYAAQHLNHCQQ